MNGLKLFLRVFFLLFAFFLSSSKLSASYEITELKNNKVLFISDKKLKNEIITEFKTCSSFFNESNEKKTNDDNFLIKTEIQNLKKIIIAHGFCSVLFSNTIENNFQKVEITLGNLHKIKNIFLEIDYITEKEEKEIFEIITKGIKKGDPVSFKKVEEIKNKIFKKLKNFGYFFCNGHNPEIEIFEGTDETSLTFVFDAFEKNKIDKIKINGLKSIKEKVLNKMITIKTGKTLTPIEITETKDNLIKSNLFNSISITPKLKKNKIKNYIDILINVSESNHKSFGLGLYYYFLDGAQANIFWENRNFFGIAHELGLKFSVGKREKSGAIFYKIPFFFSLKSGLKFNLQLLNLQNVAYSGNKFLINAIITNDFNKNFFFSVGEEFENSKIKTSSSQCEYSFINFYSQISLKKLDETFAPQNGIKFDFECIPSFGKILNDDFFLYKNLFLFTLKSNFVFYKSFINNFLKISTLISGGKIFKNENKFTPADKRFYGGEKNQMKSYGYKMASPLNSNYEPIGGDSFLMISFSPNLMLSEKVSFGIFYEASKVFWDKKDEKFLNKDEILKNFGILDGVGISFKYYFSEIFPINFDLAFPLKRRKNCENKNIDAPFQIHFSIGSTF